MIEEKEVEELAGRYAFSDAFNKDDV